MPEEQDWPAIFNEVFAAEPSPIIEEIWRQVYRDEFPAEVEPYSYVTRTELAAFTRELSLGAESVLLDVGCGRGGPGLWIAAATGAALVGVDISSEALARAARRARSLGLEDRATFLLGEFATIPVRDASASALMSIDALLFAPDKALALREIFRVLAPGGRFVATTWDYHTQPAGRPPQVADHRPLLIEAGFDVLAYDETPGWLENQREIERLSATRVGDLAREAGVSEEEYREGIAEMEATFETMLRRVFISAQRPLDDPAREVATR